VKNLRENAQVHRPIAPMKRVIRIFTVLGLARFVTSKLGLPSVPGLTLPLNARGREKAKS
jgi:hypothetical protein